MDNIQETELDEIETRKSVNDIPRLLAIIRATPAPPDRIVRVDKLLEILLSHHASYHDHKEKMAHAVLLVQIAAFGAVASSAVWPPAWVKGFFMWLRFDKGIFLSIDREWVGFLALLLVWALSHFLLRWQLKNRRWAALQYAGALKTARDWAVNPPTPDEIKPAARSDKDKAWKDRLAAALNSLLDYIYPHTRTLGTVRPDVSEEGFPEGLVRRTNKESWTGAARAEWVPTIGSYLILIGLYLSAFR